MDAELSAGWCGKGEGIGLVIFMQQSFINDKPVCSLVIRCYNEEKHIDNLLSGVMAQSLKGVEIILVDSGSTDATLSVAAKYPVRVLRIAQEEFSFGHSLNIGCAAASADIIVFASAHVYPVYKDWLEHLITPFDDPEVALVYGKQRAAADAWYAEQQIYKKWFPDSSITEQSHPFCNNANAAIRKSLWEISPYNSELTGLEDLEWAKRHYEAGRKIVYSAEAEILHVHDERPRQIYNRYRREAIAFKRIYSDKSFTLLDFLLLFVANAFSDICHAWRDGIPLRELPGIPLFRLLQFWGTYRGYRQKGGVPRELANRFYYPNGLSLSKTVTSVEKERLIRYE